MYSNYNSLLILDSFSGCDWTGGSTYEGKYDCCSSSHQCGVSEGDCDNDDECFGNLLCGSNNCFPPFPPSVDCCYDPFLGKKRF